MLLYYEETQNFAESKTLRKVKVVGGDLDESK